METFQQRFQRLWSLDVMTDRLTEAVPTDMIETVYDALGDRVEGDSLSDWVRRGGQGRSLRQAIGRMARLAHTRTLPHEVPLTLDEPPADFGRLLFDMIGDDVSVRFIARHPAHARELIGDATVRLAVRQAINVELVELVPLLLDRLQMVAKGKVVDPEAIRALTNATEWLVVW